MIFVVLFFANVALATVCYINSARTQAGACTVRSACTGSGAAWVASTTWGRKTAWGCERISNARCCYRAPARTTAATTTLPRVVPGTTRPPQPSVTAATQDLDGVQAQLVEFHNAERRCYGVPAMQWDTSLERSALIYASKCNWGHDPDNESQGENLAAGSGQQDEITLVNGWLEEQTAWDCRNNRPYSRGVVGHYTQMIWATSTRVGCATIACHTGSPFGSRYGSQWTFTVCRYGGPGNYVGEHPLGSNGANRCGSCARSVKSQDDLWGDTESPFEVCVPSDVKGETGCVCPDSSQSTDGSCAPLTELPCTAKPLKCKDGTTQYPRPPSCVVSCPGEESSAAAVSTAALAVTAGAVLVL